MGDRVIVPGSERSLVGEHVRVADLDPSEEIEVSVYLAHRTEPDWIDDEARRPPLVRWWVARERWEASHGASPDAVQRVRGFAAEHGLSVLDVDGARRRMRLRGSLSRMQGAFEAGFEGRYAVSASPGARTYRARRGPLTVPAALDGVVTGVFGLDDRPQARPAIRVLATGAVASAHTPPQVAAAYDFPAGDGGAGHAVAIVELGGGFRQTDLDTYFDSLSISPGPTVTAVAVDGGANSPGTDPDADGEVMLDIEVLGAIAPRAAIVVYFAVNTDQGFIDAVSEAVHDATHAPTAVSISWGGSEDSWTVQARDQMEQILTDAGGLGVTVTVAAGDSGSADGVSGGGVHVDFPASAPHALACGGTTLSLHGTQITSETVWSSIASGGGATGGGVSDAFPLPSYQASAGVPDRSGTSASGRGVPDVAGDADPQTGYAIRVDGASETVGGTSAVAPLWAALVVLLANALGAPLGFAQPRLYPLLGSAGFHDITSGSNGAYSAGPGWDACTGCGTPDGGALVTGLGRAAT